MKRLHNHLHQAFALAVCGFAFLVSACHKGGGSGSASKTEEGKFVLEEGRYLLPQSAQAATVSIEQFGLKIAFNIKDTQVASDMWKAGIGSGVFEMITINNIDIAEGEAYQIVNMSNDTITINLTLEGTNGERIKIEDLVIEFSAVNDEMGRRFGKIISGRASYTLLDLPDTFSWEFNDAKITVTF